MTPGKRVSLIGVAIVVLISIGIFVVSVNQKEYRTLFSNLSAEDAGGIVARLQEKKIPYKVSRSGDAVLVPEEHISELRIDLAVSADYSGTAVVHVDLGDGLGRLVDAGAETPLDVAAEAEFVLSLGIDLSTDGSLEPFLFVAPDETSLAWTVQASHAEGLD